MPISAMVSGREPDGERVLPHAIRSEMIARADGTLGVLTPGSMKPVTSIVHHAGICKVKRHVFEVP
jgi:hypothetical protein